MELFFVNVNYVHSRQYSLDTDYSIVFNDALFISTIETGYDFIW